MKTYATRKGEKTMNKPTISECVEVLAFYSKIENLSGQSLKINRLAFDRLLELFEMGEESVGEVWSVRIGSNIVSTHKSEREATEAVGERLLSGCYSVQYAGKWTVTQEKQ